MIFKGHQEDEFFILLKESADLICAAAATLKTALADPATRSDKLAELTKIEHQADKVTDAIIVRLHKTLVTPMDREDIFALATEQDDIIDFILGALERVVIYNASGHFASVQELTRLLNECAVLTRESVGYLSNIKGKINIIIENSQKISDLESEGDLAYKFEMAKLFAEEKDPIEIIKWKEILEQLENTLDICETLSNSVKGAVLKYA